MAIFAEILFVESFRFLMTILAFFHLYHRLLFSQCSSSLPEHAHADLSICPGFVGSLESLLRRLVLLAQADVPPIGNRYGSRRSNHGLNLLKDTFQNARLLSCCFRFGCVLRHHNRPCSCPFGRRRRFVHIWPSSS